MKYYIFNLIITSILSLLKIFNIITWSWWCITLLLFAPEIMALFAYVMYMFCKPAIDLFRILKGNMQ